MKEGHRLIERCVEASALFLFCLLFVVSDPLYAGRHGDVSWDLSISPDSLYIGDPIFLSLSLIYPESVDVVIEGLSAPAGQFEVIGKGNVKSSTSEGIRVDSLSLTLTTFETGRHQLGPIEIQMAVMGIPDTLVLEGESVNVLSLLEQEPADIKDIKDLLPSDRSSRLAWVLIAGAALILFSLLLWLWRRRRPRRFEVARDSKPLIPPGQWALVELQKIERMELLSRGMVKIHYTLVSEVLRKYLNMKYGVVTLERTTTEIKRDLKNRSLPEEHLARFTELLEESDLVKFARLEPDGERSGSLIPASREVVEATISGTGPGDSQEKTYAAG